MKISTSFDFGNPLVSTNDVKATVTIEVALGESAYIPNVREVLADAVEPLFKKFSMPETGIAEEKERILLSGTLFNSVKGEYRYDCESHEIYHRKNRDLRYSVRDYLEGNIPGLSK